MSTWVHASIRMCFAIASAAVNLCTMKAIVLNIYYRLVLQSSAIAENLQKWAQFDGLLLFTVQKVRYALKHAQLFQQSVYIAV